MSSNCMRVSLFIRLKNFDNVGCDSRASFLRTAWQTEFKGSSSARSFLKYAEMIDNLF